MAPVPALALAATDPNRDARPWRITVAAAGLQWTANVADQEDPLREDTPIPGAVPQAPHKNQDMADTRMMGMVHLCRLCAETLDPRNAA